MRYFTLFLCLICWLSTFWLKAQANLWQFKHLSSENGLESPDVQAILQDKRGFLWIATMGGLHRFDGYTCKVFQHEVSNPHSISSNIIYFLYETQDGMIWLGTRHGLNMFDPATEKFTVYNQYEGKNILENKSIRHIYQDKKGYLWVSVSMVGLLRFDIKNKTFDKWYHVDNTQNEIFKHPKFIFEDSYKNIWIGGDEGIGLYFAKENKLINLPQKTLPSLYFKCILQDSLKNIWIGTDKGILKLAAQKLKTFQNDEVEKIILESITVHTKPKSLINNYVKCLTIDVEQNLWVGTDEGISILPYENNRQSLYEFITLQYDENNLHSLANNYCRFMFTDLNGIVWIATGTGVSYYAKNLFPFTCHKNEPNKPQTLNDNYVKAICYEQNADSTQKIIWLGTNSGLARYDENKQSYTFYQTHNSNLPHNYVKTIVQDQQNNLWIGTDKGLVKLDLKTQKMQVYSHEDKDKNSLLDNAINSLYADKEGQIWVGTWKGLSKYIPEKDNFKVIYPAFNDRVQAILKDNDNEMWIAMREGLIRMANENSVNVITYTHLPDKKNSLTSSYINCLAQGQKDQILIGTSNGGLNIFDKKTAKFSAITTKNGLLSDNINFVIESKNQYIWLGTDKGLSKILLDSLDMHNYTTEDGLASNAFNHLAVTQTPKGEIYAGSVKGFVSFAPQKVQITHKVLPIYFTDFKLFQQSIKVSESSILTKTPMFQKQIVLKHTDKMMTFNFVALDFLNPTQIHYIYKMEGFDDEWIEVSANQRQATYTNLPAGSYRFVVKTDNSTNIHHHKEALIYLIIKPPFWKTWWFVTLTATLFFALLYFVVRWRATQLRNIQKRLQKQVEERTAELVAQKKVLENANIEIAINIEEIEAQRDEIEAQRDNITKINTSLEILVTERTQKLMAANKELDDFMYRAAHDLKGPLARIKGLVHLGRLETHDDIAMDYFDKLDKITVDMLQILNRIRHIHDIKNKVINKELIDFEAITEQVLYSLIVKQDTSRLKIQTEITPHLDFESDKELISMILYNLLNNATTYQRYSTDSKVIISIKPTYSLEKYYNVEIMITDNGIGIDESEKHRVFEMFFVGTPISKGMGLGLYETKIIAEKLNGEVGFSCKNGWTKFWVKL
jgi:ligand-binding sensor domain-containing protein/signal transduction histidine kinase